MYGSAIKENCYPCYILIYALFIGAVCSNLYRYSFWMSVFLLNYNKKSSYIKSQLPAGRGFY